MDPDETAAQAPNEPADELAALDFQDWRSLFRVDRRQFLKGLTAGIAVAVSLGEARGADEPSRPAAGQQSSLPTDFNAFLSIHSDGKVSGFTGKIEMGQGIVTSLAQMLADELDAPLASVELVMGDTDRCPYDMGTWGSLSTRVFGPAFRAAAAEARAVLLELAAEKLALPKSQLLVADGVIMDARDRSRRVSYGELAQGQKIQRHLRLRPQPQTQTKTKSRAQLRLIGKPLERRDGRGKVTGEAQYAGDIRLPGMRYAALLRPPAHGAKLKRLDLGPAKQIEGVELVREGDLVAVLHASPDLAARALGQVEAEWEVPEGGPDERSIYQHLLELAPPATTLDAGGDLKKGEKQARQRFESTYHNAYVAHAPMEPHAALARIEGGRATIWASTQSPFGLQREAAEALGVALDRVRVVTPPVGGGFGGKSRNLQALEAVRLAKLVGKPVQVAWSRAEELFYDSFRPAAIVKLRSGLDKKGRVAFWDYQVYYAGERGAQHVYDFAHHRTSTHGSGWKAPPGAHPFATGAWRAPGNNTNTFARESQIDLMAAAAGVDPLEFRLRHAKDPRLIAVLKAAAQRFGWKPAKGPSGRGQGLACGTDAGTYVATMCELKVDPSGAVAVARVVCAQDMGLVVNPQGAISQTEGGITMGLGYTLTEELRFKGGAISDTNFDTYQIPRFTDAPKIDCVFVDSGLAPQGGGEPAIITTGAVVANAIFDATGARLYALPMTPERVKQAMAAVSKG